MLNNKKLFCSIIAIFSLSVLSNLAFANDCKNLKLQIYNTSGKSMKDITLVVTGHNIKTFDLKNHQCRNINVNRIARIAGGCEGKYYFIGGKPGPTTNGHWIDAKKKTFKSALIRPVKAKNGLYELRWNWYKKPLKNCSK